MRIRWLAAVAAVAALGGVAGAQGNKPEPTVEVRVRSVNDLLDKAEYVAGLAGQDEVVKQVREIVKQLSADGKGIKGVDPKRPFGLTATLTGEVVDSPILVMVPIADQEQFLALLKDTAGLAPEKAADGTYKVSDVPFFNDLYLRFADGYLFVARSAKDVDPKALPAPKAFFAKDDGAVASVLVRFDAIPPELIKFVTGQLELGIAEQRRKLGDNASPAEKAALDLGSEVVVGGLKTFIEESKELALRVYVDEKADELSAELTLTAKPGTTLARNIAALGGKTSLPAGVVGTKGTVARATVTAGLPDSLKKDLAKVIDAGIDEAVKKAAADEKALVEKVLKTLAPTLKAGEVDAAVALNGPDAKGRHVLLAALAVKKGKDVEKLAKDLAKDFGGNLGDAVKFDFDVEKVGGFTLHTVTVKDLPPEVEKVFGPAKVWLATSEDLIALSVEPDGAALRAGLKAKPAAVPVLSVEVEAAKLLPVVARVARPDAAVAEFFLKGLIADVFGKDGPAGKDTLTVTVTGGDRFAVKAKVKGKAVRLVFKVLDAMDQLNKK